MGVRRRHRRPAVTGSGVSADQPLARGRPGDEDPAMTTRNLEAMFAPRAIALIGASNEPGTVGAVLARNLMESGFAGPVLAVNPHDTAIRSTLSYRSLAELPMAPDLAVI